MCWIAAITSSPFCTTLIGAVVGAAVGGGISLGLQVMGAKSARKERIAAKLQADKATAFAISAKIIRMHTCVNGIREGAEEAAA
jgi:hypothetical protein